MTWKTSLLFALALIAMPAASVYGQTGDAGQGAPSVHEGRPLPPSGSDDRRREVEDEDEDPLDRWQREDDADQLEQRSEHRQERALEKRLDQQFDDQPERE